MTRSPGESAQSLAVDDRNLSAFRPIRLRKAADEVVAVLLDAIRGGHYAPGDLLPRERDLARQLGVSRPVLREAIDVLRRSGIVSVKRGASGGAVVTSLANLPRVLASLHGDTRSEIRSLLEVRRPLELAGALLAAPRAREEDLERLGGLVDELETALNEPDVFLAIDARFHLMVAELSGNPVLLELLREILDRFLVFRSQFPVGHVELRRAVENQRRTLHALQNRDPDRIVRSVDEHLGDLEEVFLGEKLPLWGAA